MAKHTDKGAPGEEQKLLLAQIAADAANVEAAPDILATITTSAHELLRLRARVIELDAAAKEASTALRVLEQDVLPQLMDEAGVSELKLDDTGHTIKREESVYASISKANAPSAAHWLDDNGYGALVKTRFVLEFDKDSSAEAREARATLKTAGLVFSETEAVHPSTLTAFVKESIREARALPPSITYHVQPTVKVVEPKKKR